MSVEERFNLIKQVGEEIITEDELKDVLSKKKNPIAYDGFEPSGRIHIAQGVMRAINVNKMVKAGCKFKMFVADWHGWANNKMGGDLKAIQTVGHYFIEVWKSCGMPTDKVEFVWASELCSKSDYWRIVMQVARNATVKRIFRCAQIMGRKEGESLQASQIFYPCMQAADMFYLNVDIAQLGMDQRKVNMLAREIGPKLGFKAPIAVHHHMLMGLKNPVSAEKNAIERSIELKMSKSNPESSIFMDDSEKDVKRKIMNAYCPPKQVNENPIMEYVKYIIFEKFDSMIIERSERFGGAVEFKSYYELEKAFGEGALHPLDLKKGTIDYLIRILNEFRKNFNKSARAKKLEQEVKKLRVSR